MKKTFENVNGKTLNKLVDKINDRIRKFSFDNHTYQVCVFNLYRGGYTETKEVYDIYHDYNEERTVVSLLGTEQQDVALYFFDYYKYDVKIVKYNANICISIYKYVQNYR